MAANQAPTKYQHALDVKDVYSLSSEKLVVRILLSADQARVWQSKTVSIEGLETTLHLQPFPTTHVILQVSGDVDQLAQGLVEIVKGIDKTQNSQSLCISLAISTILLGSTTFYSQNFVPKSHSAAPNVSIKRSVSYLPRSTERALTVCGPAEEFSKSLEQILKLLQERTAALETSRVVPYVPEPVYGLYGSPATFQSIPASSTLLTPNNPYGIAPASLISATANPDPLGASQVIQHPGPSIPPNTVSQRVITQQFSVPKALAQSVLSRSPTKLQEVAQDCNTQIELPQADAQNDEQILLISGSAEAVQMTLVSLYALFDSQNQPQQ
ncbi:U1 snRNP-associated protein Usp108 [Schizosaccharomyces japonicus yFS275]|uniref:U1 snRNP-associated protein Usp108 n=1 Tax=Schizosaccharomyces japonicus (strain yFS275 / FY16936) TaxID=402676 RepID=B6JX90_SCHJY|nr:U1 snRNP-associated protein Usp108 [Schizosaccharomyces japonicus yFS275]EEB05991.1 U1 snRNP-associated protein Usp108 [Schizosaccharomyces japonicus yFS275]